MVLGSDFIGQSTLNGPFESSRGFGITFTAAGRTEVEARFPAFEPWLVRSLGVPALRALTPWWRRRGHDRLPNAWYLNVLVIGPNAGVARHLDGTLMRMADVTDHPPECVSVLYLAVPDDLRGGELQLWQGPIPRETVSPRQGEALHFRGDLAHAVLPFEGAADQRRVSLVIEQYHFDEIALSKLPAFRLESRVAFGVFLDDHRQRPPKAFDLEP